MCRSACDDFVPEDAEKKPDPEDESPAFPSYEEKGVWSEFAEEGLEEMQREEAEAEPTRPMSVCENSAMGQSARSSVSFSLFSGSSESASTKPSKSLSSSEDISGEKD